jgi:hypothetical protein
MAAKIREVLLHESSLRAPPSVWGRKLRLSDKQVGAGIDEGDEDVEKGDEDFEKDDNQALSKTDAALSKVLEDFDCGYNSNTELLVDQDIVDAEDKACYDEEANTSVHWAQKVPSDLSDAEINARVAKLLTPTQINENRLTQEDVDLCMRSIGPEIHPELPFGMGISGLS